MAINDRREAGFPYSGDSHSGDSLVSSIVRRFLGDCGPVGLSRINQGLSGGRVFRCETARGVFALKQWPPGTPAERVDLVHEVQRKVGSIVPFLPELQPCLVEPATRVTIQGLHFELSTWRPGSPFEPTATDGPGSVQASRQASEALGRGAAAIARFHQASDTLARETLAGATLPGDTFGCVSGIAPAVTRRLQRLETLKALVPIALKQRGWTSASLMLARKMLAEQWRLLHEQSERRLRPWLARPVPISWVLRDVHREHVLFKDGEVSGIVDFDALNRDTVATDLARWVGSFAELGVFPEVRATAELWSFVIAQYNGCRAISPCEQELAGAIEEASWYIQLANWVVWTADKDREIPGGIDAAERRVAGLLRSGETQAKLRCK